MDLKIRSIIFLLLLSAFSAPADEWQHYFDSANMHYKNGEYEQAIEEYKKILEYGYESGELYFNLGNAYYKLNELGRARLNYERALQYLKGDEALQQNLKMVELRLVDQIEEPPKLILQVWWEHLLNLFSIGTLAVLVLAVFWGLLILAAYRLYLIRRGRKDWIRTIFIVFFVIFVFFCILFIQKIYIFETEEHGVILADKVTLYAEPAENSTELFVLHEGIKVEIIRSANEWYEVKLVDGKTGWIVDSAIEII